ncbi:MAG TPA: Lrp/AsnC ligand binding domain-containing protein [Thermoplasmata archaeon]|nr:Lrp/AsnC ligand binding domain-containing protein [Thermoplasmata archaeon]
MADRTPRELSIYVQSKKVVTTFYRPPSGPVDVGLTPEAAASDVSGHGSGDATVASGEGFFLSDDQARCVALVEDLAQRRGYRIEVVDVARAGRIEKLISERLRSVSRFPVLFGPSDQRLEGVESFTEDHLCELMPAELAVLRAFTYLKIRGGDLERIRDRLLAFPHVREIHLLTGDWDMFAVLEFPGSKSPKREVLEFVTSRLRTIPDVVDTSTLVPEHSVSKFPF